MMGYVDTGNVTLEELKKGFAHFVKKEQFELRQEESKEQVPQTSKSEKHDLDPNIVPIKTLVESEYLDMDTQTEVQ